MKDEVQRIHKRLQELRELHMTGFVNDAQYAESLLILERKLVDAVMKEEEAAAEAAFAPTMLFDPSSPLPPEGVAVAPRRASVPRWLPWVAAAVLVHLLALAVWWWPGGTE